MAFAKNMNNETLWGSWLLVGSEISTLQPESEIFHFRENGRLDLEIKCNALNSTTEKLFYELDNEVIRFGLRKQLNISLKVQIDCGYLIGLDEQGMETWFKKLDYGYYPLWSDRNTSNYTLPKPVNSE